MSKCLNKVELIGYVGNSPSMTTLPSGDLVANFNIATDESRIDKKTKEKKTATEWHKIVCYSKLAEIVESNLHKGSKIYIEGRLRTRKWDNEKGETQYTTEIMGKEMILLDLPPKNNGS